jgi:thiol-disulfide isomerase/thioredoxin
MIFSRKAHEIVSKDENWINSKPLTLADLKGKPVLLDFWTYSCINCLRTLPSMKAMWKKYEGKVMIIGIHTPEFDFEKELENVKDAVKRLEIDYPVLSDPERKNWDNYGNQYWPRSALINGKGEIIKDHIGESGYDELDTAIMNELGIAGEEISEEMKSYPLGLSPETYAGKRRNNGIGSSMVCTKQGCQYYDPGKHEDNVIYLAGDWNQEDEFLEFRGDKGYMTYKFLASEVNVVMDGNGTAEVLLNHKPLMKDAGKHVSKSKIKVDHADMYNLVKLDKAENAELEIVPFKGLKVYAYTFG